MSPSLTNEVFLFYYSSIFPSVAGPPIAKGLKTINIYIHLYISELCIIKQIIYRIVVDLFTQGLTV